MIKHLFYAPVLLIAFLTAGAAAGEITQVRWIDLVPEQRVPLNDGRDNLYGVAADMDGRTVRLAGFVVPVKSAPGGRLSAFLLVPHSSACIHENLRKPNQTIFVRTENAVQFQHPMRPVVVEGRMSTRAMRNNRGEAAGYQMSLTQMGPVAMGDTYNHGL